MFYWLQNKQTAIFVDATATAWSLQLILYTAVTVTMMYRYTKENDKRYKTTRRFVEKKRSHFYC